MRTGHAVVWAAVLAVAVASQADAQGPRVTTRATMKNDVGIELLGRAVAYSFTYQRMITSSFALDVGLGALGGGGGGEDATIVFFPVGAKFYVIPRDGSLYLTGGAVVVTGTIDSGPFSDSATDAYSFAGLGFEFRSSGGFLFRGTAYGLLGGGEWFIWPGITLGYAF